MVATKVVEQLLQKLTVEEKVSLLAGADTWQTQEICRLGIGSLKVSFRSDSALPDDSS
jgi:beta-glucosidase